MVSLETPMRRLRCWARKHKLIKQKDTYGPELRIQTLPYPPKRQSRLIDIHEALASAPRDVVRQLDSWKRRSQYERLE